MCILAKGGRIGFYQVIYKVSTLNYDQAGRRFKSPLCIIFYSMILNFGSMLGMCVCATLINQKQAQCYACYYFDWIGVIRYCNTCILG